MLGAHPPNSFVLTLPCFKLSSPTGTHLCPLRSSICGSSIRYPHKLPLRNCSKTLQTAETFRVTCDVRSSKLFSVVNLPDLIFLKFVYDVDLVQNTRTFYPRWKFPKRFLRPFVANKAMRSGREAKN